MAGVKRSINGQAKPQNQPQQPEDVAMTDATPPCGQPQSPSSKTTSSETTTEEQKNPPKPVPSTKKPASKSAPAKPSHSRPTNRNSRQKLAKLPKNTTITIRPLLHAPLPSPFASSAAPKMLYITATTPYIPAIKRIRKLLTQITKREKQSAASLNKSRGRGGGRYAEANGRLEPKDVEAEIARAAVGRAGGGGSGIGNKGNGGGASAGAGTGKGEEVYLKATGRAIPRALELGLHFQGEEDCRVKVEMGSVSAIDDIEVKSRVAEEDNRGEEGSGMAEEEDQADDVPETRIRMLSSITVTVGLN